MTLRWWSDPKWVDKTPIVTTLLLEGANVAQLIRMWTERSALGQSLVGWLSVSFALVLWYNFYRVVTPAARWARWATLFGIGMNALVCLSVMYFRLRS
jgi:hypothetical protein